MPAWRPRTLPATLPALPNLPPHNAGSRLWLRWNVGGRDHLPAGGFAQLAAGNPGNTTRPQAPLWPRPPSLISEPRETGNTPARVCVLRLRIWFSFAFRERSRATSSLQLIDLHLQPLIRASQFNDDLNQFFPAELSSCSTTPGCTSCTARSRTFFVGDLLQPSR
jgi:hypothetical protein